MHHTHVQFASLHASCRIVGAAGRMDLFGASAGEKLAHLHPRFACPKNNNEFGLRGISAAVRMSMAPRCTVVGGVILGYARRCPRGAPGGFARRHRKLESKDSPAQEPSQDVPRAWGHARNGWRPARHRDWCGLWESQCSRGCSFLLKGRARGSSARQRPPRPPVQD